MKKCACLPKIHNKDNKQCPLYSTCVCMWCNAQTLMMRDKTIITVHALNCRMYKSGMTMEDLKLYNEDFEEIKVFYSKITGTD